VFLRTYAPISGYRYI